MAAEVGPLDGVMVLEVANWYAKTRQSIAPPSRATQPRGCSLARWLAVHRIAGPCCGALLADMGATVIKVEPPEGDSMRYVQRQPQDADGNFQQNGECIDHGCLSQRLLQRLLPRLLPRLLQRLLPRLLQRSGAQ